MKDGLYKVEFQGSGLGSGVVFLSSGIVRGGDSMMYYVGKYDVADGQFSADLHVRKHSDVSGMSSTMGSNDFHLKLKGSATDESAQIQGTAVEAPNLLFQARMSKLSD